MPDDQIEEKAQLLEQAARLARAAKAIIANNPTLLLPATEDQAVDVAIVLLLLLMLAGGDSDNMRAWLREMLHRAHFALRTYGHIRAYCGPMVSSSSFRNAETMSTERR
jgi:hypothetical protein